MNLQFDNTAHWEGIYQNKQLHEVSWHQPIPHTSLALIEKLNLPKSASMIDIGGGDSFLTDNLLEQGYEHLSVLDISNKAMERAKMRLGTKAQKVCWIVSDITKYEPEQQFQVWHDRAAFHFLTQPEDIAKYVTLAEKSIPKDSFLIIGTFSDQGPKKCSGIDIKQYSTEELASVFASSFELLESFNVDHKTPFDTMQHFSFCSFSRK